MLLHCREVLKIASSPSNISSDRNVWQCAVAAPKGVSNAGPVKLLSNMKTPAGVRQVRIKIYLPSEGM